MKLLFKDIQEDKGLIGKISSDNEDTFVAKILGTGTEVSWDDFKYNLSQVIWQKKEETTLQDQIANLYYDANKKMNLG